MLKVIRRNNLFLADDLICGRFNALHPYATDKNARQTLRARVTQNLILRIQSRARMGTGYPPPQSGHAVRRVYAIMIIIIVIKCVFVWRMGNN